MKKVFAVSLLFFTLYAIVVFLYISTASPPALPPDYLGTEADPQLFMNEEQLQQAKTYSMWRNILSFIFIPFEWLVLLFVVCFGVSRFFANWSEEISKFRLLQTVLYVVLLSCFVAFVQFPLNYLSYWLSKKYQLSIQPFTGWMKDQLISFWVEAFILTIVASVIMLLLRKKPRRWWLYTWSLSIPFTLFLLYIQPVIIDPLYHHFSPIQDKELEGELLQLAREAEIPANHVYQVEMSGKTTTLNAYVTGIGSNLRIVLWDTTLEKLTKDEVLFVMAHEMGHYRLQHIKKHLLIAIVVSFLGLYLTHKMLHFFFRKFAKRLSFKQDHLAALPVILMIFSILSFVEAPITNAVSRHYEYEADRFALQLTGNSEAATATFQKLAVEGLTEIQPLPLVKIFRYTHPPIIERITRIGEYGE